MYFLTSRTAGDHYHRTNGANTSASTGIAQSFFVHGRPQMAHRSTGPPNSAPSLTALPPIGVSMASASVDPAAYRTAPQRRADCSRGRTSRQASANSGIGTYADVGNGAQPPSGKAHDRNTGGRNAAAAIARPS